MKIFDCFLFSDEIELLRLRLTIMGPHVDGFVVMEGNQTFSGMRRELQFPRYAQQLPYSEKIKYVSVTEFPETDSAWEREHFLRDQLRTIVPAQPHDVILISDVDEIINLPEVMRHYDKAAPARIELASFYHFMNVRSSEKIRVNLISPFHFLTGVHIGDRNNYKSLAPLIIPDKDGRNGGHFTYMYGYDVDRYVKKIQSFSHGELNTPYYTDQDRISKCVSWNLDLFERDQFRYKHVSLKRIFPEMANAINHGVATLPIKAKGGCSSLGGLSRYGHIYYWKRKYHQYRYMRARMKKRSLKLIREYVRGFR